MKIKYIVVLQNTMSILHSKMYIQKVISYKKKLFTYTFLLEEAHKYTNKKYVEKPARIFNGKVEVI